MPIKILDAPAHPWGDYGDILVQGMASHLDRASDGGLQLERTGPFVPPVTFPGIGVMVLTDEFRRRLDGAGLGKFTFRPVHKTRIVLLNWHLWDPTTDEPPEYPDSGEPEDYVLDGVHDPATAQAIGPRWEVELRPGIGVRRETDASGIATAILVLAATWTGADLFKAAGVVYIYASERAQEWLLRETPQWIELKDCRLV